MKLSAESKRRPSLQSICDDFLESDERPSEDEEDVRRVNGILLTPARPTLSSLYASNLSTSSPISTSSSTRVPLSPSIPFSLSINRNSSTLNHFQETLLHAFSTYVPAMRHDGGFGELVDFVEEDYSGFAF